MQYSLLSRFQGAMAGLSFGSRLRLPPEKSVFLSGASPQKENHGSQILLNLKQHQLKGCESEGKDEQFTSSDCESLVIQMTRSLIRCQGLERVDWNQSWQKWQQEQQSSPSGVKEESNLARTRPKSVAEVAVATVPITLLFHEQPAQLQQQLQQGIQVWQESPSCEVLEQAVIAFNSAIALALKEELDPQTLIPTLLNYLDPQIDLHQQLQQVQSLVEQRVSLETARELLLKNSQELAIYSKTEKSWVGSQDTTPIALAFYSFVSTPHNPAIALLRTVEMDPLTPIVSILTGALSGAYNSISSFPLSWRLQLQTTTTSSSPIISAETPAKSRKQSVGETLQKATELFAVWSGVYNTANPFLETDSTLAVAAPNVIHPRQF
ncbi:ADP-ribosylglycohydrolase family protein [Lyngbya sp. PCC 8106]|uniref:ADP-ribosylglycohydrolase family protein n=1 Tax=Lyngbya sp. (strain PCC 8106) TaxID=313612 RepID=UPI0000EAA443|nr:ADP-ribosylglycohydrolase family protein [Lyngbya sp. PCC 8106]EAW34416.1 3-dehydroquinate dehydratase [Lyngbya sp. PCC 8106]